MEPQNEKQVYKNSQNSYEEISEKRTSKLGYILLVIMVVFVIGVGETIFSDLRKIPKRPISPSRCVSKLFEDLENLIYFDCYDYGFSEVDKKFQLDTKINNIKPELQKISSLNKDINSNKKIVGDLEKNIQNLDKDYNLSLQEKIAGESAIMNKPEIKNQISELRIRIETINKDNNSLIAQRSSAISKITSPVESIEKSYKEAYDYYLTSVAWFKFKVFSLTLVFVLPFFILSVFFYLRLKRKDSPYTIILTASTTAFSFLFLQVTGVFLYDILPKEWLARIFEFFLDVPFLRYIIYYGSVILIIGLFGGIVYYIQKKVFDPRRVAVRRLKDKKCPGCSFGLDPSHIFCPNCGLQLKEKCENCGNLKIRYLSHCPNCGKE